MFSFLNNIPQVTKNILILNVFMFIIKLFYESQGIDLDQILGAYYVISPLFKPFQIVSHFFMHADFFHILMNMWLFVMLGTYLERLWGAKKFFTFYLISAFGAFALYNIKGVYKLVELKQQLSNFINIDDLNSALINSNSKDGLINNVNLLLNQNSGNININQLSNYISYCSTPMIGASGAVFGILAAFALLFPNTEFYLYMAIPVKAKYLVGGYFLWELYRSFNGLPGDNVAHLAHVGGAISGAIMIFIWRKTDRKNFW